MKKQLAIGLGIVGIIAVFSGVLTLNNFLAFLFAGAIPGTNLSISPIFTLVSLTLLACLFIAHIMTDYLSFRLFKSGSTEQKSASLAKKKKPMRSIARGLVIPERNVGHELPPRRFHRL